MRVHNVYPDIFPEPWTSDWGEDEYGLWMAFTYKGVRQMFRWIEPGTFMMGSPESEPERYDDEDYHQVTLSQGFWLADSCVTQALWLAVMGNNPSHFLGENRPVEQVSWHAAQKFMQRLNSLLPDLRLCLPTEAQWEYACRAGTTTPFAFGQQIDSSLVNFNGNRPYNNGRKSEYRQQTIAVKSLAANAWGLYEMHGNVWEWCQDVWQDNLGATAAIDPCVLGDADSSRVLRGGSWYDFGRNVRSVYRDPLEPSNRSYNLGFRLSRG